MISTCSLWASERLSGVQVSKPTGDCSESIGTHNGHFHCDEALACGMLMLTDKYHTLPVVRTRDQSIIESCKIVVDVGGTFDAEKLRFDHHQRDFQNIFFDDVKKTKLSSAGLVYKYFGKEVIGNLTRAQGANEDIVDILYNKVYEGFIEHVDGIDNGIEPYTGEKNYSISTNLSSRVGSLNVPWNQENTTEIEMEQFKKAIMLATTEFVNHVSQLLTIWLPARSIVEESVKRRHDIDDSGYILLLAQPCPWKSHLYDLEDESFSGLSKGDVKYVLYPDSNGQWRVQCVSMHDGSFQNRLSLPEKYRGVRDEALSELWNIPGCVFVHAAGFIAGNKTYEGALQMARNSLKQI